jgi:hypothetical protein
MCRLVESVTTTRVLLLAMRPIAVASAPGNYLLKPVDYLTIKQQIPRTRSDRTERHIPQLPGKQQLISKLSMMNCSEHTLPNENGAKSPCKPKYRRTVPSSVTTRSSSSSDQPRPRIVPYSHYFALVTGRTAAKGHTALTFNRLISFPE